jgi:hypothetical protein
LSVVQEHIDQYGWHVVHVLGDETGPQFSYSVGLYETFDHPEVIFIGLKHDLSHILINNIGETIREGGNYTHDNFYADILDGFECKMIEVNERHFDEYVGVAQDHYKSTFPLLQCIYPTVKGIYPWQDEWPTDLRTLQPILD